MLLFENEEDKFEENRLMGPKVSSFEGIAGTGTESWLLPGVGEVELGRPGLESRLAAKGWNPLTTLRGVVESRYSLILDWFAKCWSNETR
jgi:hypothetical protein